MNHTCPYSPAAERHRTLAGTHFPSPEGRRLSWPEWLVTNRRGFPRPQMVTHPSTNRARRRVTSSIEANALPLSQADVDVLWLNAKVDRVDVWCEDCRRKRLLCRPTRRGPDLPTKRGTSSFRGELRLGNRQTAYKSTSERLRS